MDALSSNHASRDDQVLDIVAAFNHKQSTGGLDASEVLTKFHAAFPEFESLIWSDAWMDHVASKVDPDYMSWVCDWWEQHTLVLWIEGEPYLLDQDDLDEAEHQGEGLGPNLTLLEGGAS